MKLGIIGGGSISRWHLDGYAGSEHVDNVVLAEPRPNPPAESKLMELFPNGRIVTDYKALLADDSIEVVDLCVPHHLHADLAVEALQAGKHVITEKPIATTVQDGLRMIEEAKSVGRRFFVVMNHAYALHFRRAKELIDAGELGELFMGVIHVAGNEFPTMNDSSHWKGTWDKAGGGVLIDTGYHAMYLMLDVFGKPVSVSCCAKRLVVEPDNKADDNTVVTMEFANGAIGTLILSYTVLSEPWTERRYFYGRKASLEMNDSMDTPLTLYRDHQAAETMKWTEATNPQVYGMHRCLRHYVDCIVTGKEPMLPAVHAVDTLATIKAAYRSAKSGAVERDDAS